MILEAKAITYAYSKASPIFKDFNFQIERGSFWGILGKNGAGKSTFLDLLNKVRTPQSGQIIYGEALKNDSSKVILLSHAIELSIKMTVRDFLKFHSKFYKSYSQEEEKRLIEAFRINSNIELTSLSTGQQKQVQAIAGLASRPEVLLLDEITAVLDPDARETFFNLITETNQKNKTTILLATNIKEDLAGRVSNLLYLKDDHYEIYTKSELGQVFK